MALLPQIPQIWEGSGALKHGSGFLRKPEPTFGNGGPFLGQNGVLSGLNLRVPLKWGSKWGRLLG